MQKILVTGAAGFIGANLVKRLLRDLKGATIVGIDNMNDYYDVALKEYRLKEIEECNKKSALSTFVFFKGSIADKELLENLFTEYRFDVVVNLAAQAGVRYSIDNPARFVLIHLRRFALQFLDLHLAFDLKLHSSNSQIQTGTLIVAH